MTTFVDANNKVVARGVIKEQLIDLLLNDGTRLFSTRSDGYALDALRNLQIVKVVK